jgi:hypothetical protein
MPERREFLLGGSAALAALLFKWPSLSAQLSSRIADSRIDVLLSEPLGTISPDIYGQFTENLGGVIYDGVWVGENSKVPNHYGIRSALIEQCITTLNRNRHTTFQITFELRELNSINLITSILSNEINKFLRPFPQSAV